MTDHLENMHNEEKDVQQIHSHLGRPFDRIVESLCLQIGLLRTRADEEFWDIQLPRHTVVLPHDLQHKLE